METADCVFVVSDSLKSVAKAAGITNQPSVMPLCPLVVGDIVTFPATPALAFRVTARWLRQATHQQPARWYLSLEQAGHPLEEPDAPTP